MSDGPRQALIVGASRGLGLGLAREYRHRGCAVIATVRGETPPALAALAGQAAGQASGQTQGQAAGQITVERLDINQPASLDALAARLQGGRLDLLFVNAGVSHDPALTAGATSEDEFMRVMVTNALSPLRVIERLQSLVPPGGTIAAMSSSLGSVGGNESGGFEVYRASKASLNTLMRSFAERAAGGRTILILDPGWVRTDMGGSAAPLDVETSTGGLADVIQDTFGRGGTHYLDYAGHTTPW